MKYVSHAITMIAEGVILFFAVLWYYTSGYEYEPLLVIVATAAGLVTGVLLRIPALFNKGQIQLYCETVFKQFNDIQLPLIADSKLPLAKSMAIKNIYIDLPLQMTTKSLTASNATSSKLHRLLSFFTLKINQLKNLFKTNEFNTVSIQRINSTPWSEQTHNIGTSSIDNTENGSISKLLYDHKRMIIRGDRGTGKSTLLRWLAYAYTSRALRKGSWRKITPYKLPDKNWIPILIRCSSLNGKSDLANFNEILRSQLTASWHQPSAATGFLEKILPKFSEGKILLLIDALDEIIALEQRRSFCIGLNEYIKTYPQIMVVLTVLNTTFSTINDCFQDDFTLLLIPKLDPKTKRSFVQRWAKNRGEDHEFTENLQNILNASSNIVRLTDNIQTLSLIVQLPQIKGTPQINTTQIFRETVRLLIKKSERSPTEVLTLNEVMLQLSELAYQMLQTKAADFTEEAGMSILDLYRKTLPKETTHRWHSSDQLLRLTAKYTGILEVNQSAPDYLGLEHSTYKFLHPKFQEFFTAQAIIQNHRLTDILSEIDIKEIIIYNSEDILVKEYLFEESITNFLKGLLLEELPTDQAHEVLLGLLHPVSNSSLGEARARVTFLASILPSLPNLPEYVVANVINILLDNIQPEVDGKGGTRWRTSLEEAIHALAQSDWRNLLKKQMILGYIDSAGSKRSTIGSILCTELLDAEVTAAHLNIKDFTILFDRSATSNEHDQVLHTLQLLSYAYTQREKMIESFKEDPITIHQLIDCLLDFEIASEAVQTASIWALGWILHARYTPTKEKIFLTPIQVAVLQNFIAHPAHDSVALYWACLCLSYLEETVEQPDWILEWAYVADKGLELAKLSAPHIINGNLIGSVCKHLQQVLNPSYPLIVREAAAIALGRLGRYPSSVENDLYSIFINNNYGNQLRQEAIQYLVQINSPEIARRIYQLYQDAMKEKKEFLSSYSFLALLGMGNLNSLKELALHGVDHIGMPGDLQAALYAIITHPDKKGSKKILQELFKKENKNMDDFISLILLPNKTSKDRIKIFQEIIKSVDIESEDGTVRLTDEEKIENTTCVLLVRGENPDGGTIFAYVAVRADRLEAFMEAQNSGTFYPEDYGVIVESGEGEPSADIQKQMQEEYDFDHENMLDL